MDECTFKLLELFVVTLLNFFHAVSDDEENFPTLRPDYLNNNSSKEKREFVCLFL